MSAYETIGLARKLPFEAVMRMALLGRHERITARRARQLGIVSEVVDPPDLLDNAPKRWPSSSPRTRPRPVEPPSEPCGEPSRLTDPRRPVNYSKYEHLIVERRGAVGWLINNRPDRLNAMNAEMRDEFAVAWKELDADPEVRVIVHTGEGRAFQTGVDVTEIASDGVGFERYRESVEDYDLHFTAWHQQVWKPVITAVNGICAGGGFHWVADADIVIAASDAQFFDPHVSVGQVVAMEAIGLIRKMPFEAVMRMAFVGRYERMSAARAYELGMISQIVDPPEQLRDEAQALAEKIARNSPAAMRRHQAGAVGRPGSRPHRRLPSRGQELVSMWGHPDQDEGPRAFAEKRDPVWVPLTAEPNVAG